MPRIPVPPAGPIRELTVPHAFRDRPHHGPNGRFRSPPSPHRDGRQSPAMARVLWQLMREGNVPVGFGPEAAWSRSEALAGLQQHEGLSGSGQERSGRCLPLTWLGQSAFYFKLDGIGVLTDPFLGQRASPLPFSGPKRLAPSPLRVTDLDVSIIVLSHNHYDHACVETLSALLHKSSIPVVTTLGLRPLLSRLGYTQVHELDWYQQIVIGPLQFTALPAYHFSGRSLWDTNRSLWASFGIRGSQANVFFAGDTGYGPEFARIGEYTGPYDVALVPIGAYGPREVFAAVHADPSEALRMARDVRAHQAVAMHWGTLRLTTEPFWEPRRQFLELPDPIVTAGDACSDAFHRQVLAIGETRRLNLD